MTLVEDDKLKRRRRTTTMISGATAIITILSLTLLLTYTTFVNLPQSSFAQTTNTNQTSTEAKSQPKALTFPCKLTEPTIQGPEYKAGPPFKTRTGFCQRITRTTIRAKWKGIEYGYM